MDFNDSGSELQERMRDIRAKRIHRVAELQNEAGRLVDWREHVKSAPLTALAGSALLGFVAVKSATRSSVAASTQQPQFNPSLVKATKEATLFPPGYFTNSAIRVLTSVLLTAGKAYISKQWNSKSGQSNL